MKKAIISTALLLAVLLNFAQSATPAGGRKNEPPSRPKANTANTTVSLEDKAKKTSDKMSDKLGLNPDQKNKVYSITLNYYHEKEALAPLKATNGADYKAKLKVKADEYTKQINAILTPQQQKQFSSAMDEHNKEIDSK
jgi:Spy/CpxP family protein refolding chaperone